MNSRESGVQKTSAWWAAGVVMLTAALTLWCTPPAALAETLQSLSYTYDNEGNVMAIADPLNGNQTFGYDDLDRLTAAGGSYGLVTYTYDEIGNLTRNSQVGDYKYPDSGASSVHPHAVCATG